MPSSSEQLRLAAESYLLEECLVDSSDTRPAREEHLRQLAAAKEALRRAVQDEHRSAPALPFRRVLVALDGTPEAEAAIDAAIALAQEVGSQVLICCVADTRCGCGSEDGFLAAVEARAALVEGAKSLLRQAQARIPPGNPVETLVLEGEPATEIVAAAERRGADLIIMGSRGRGPIRSALLGSTAMHVVAKATCPVMITGRCASLPTRGGRAAAAAAPEVPDPGRGA